VLRSGETCTTVGKRGATLPVLGTRRQGDRHRDTLVTVSSDIKVMGGGIVTLIKIVMLSLPL
jgi:hypothetical protein